MATVSMTKNEFLSKACGTPPLFFTKGMSVTITDAAVPLHALSEFSDLIKKVAEVFRERYVCLSDIQSDLTRIESLSPLCFRVLKPFVLRCANRANWIEPPFNRFGFRNIAILHDVDRFKRNSHEGGDIALQVHFRSNTNHPKERYEQIEYWSHDGSRKTFLEMLLKTHTDGIVILHEGQKVYERYFDGQEEKTPHIQFSVTKSLLGLIVAQLIVEGIVNPEKHIRDYIPELEGSAFADARVIELLDMTTGIKYNEEYENPDSDVRRHMIASGYLSEPPGYVHEKTLRTFLPAVKREGEHGKVFNYVSANTEVMSWVVERATEEAGLKKTVNELFDEKIWSKLGVEEEAVMLKDSEGEASWSGGFAATTKDMAKVGQMILNNGQANDQQLISVKAFEFMRNRNTRPQFAASRVEETTSPAMQGWSYANKFWWTHNSHDAFLGIGIYGQVLYIDPLARMVIAKNSSHTEAEGNWLEYDVFVAAHELSKSFLEKHAKQTR